MSKEERKRMVSKDEKLSIRQQCVLLGLCRTSLYYTASEETAENLEIMRLLDRQYAITPFYGQRRLQAWLAENGYPVNIKRLRRLMGLVRWRTLFPEHRTTVADKKAYKYPYLLKGLDIDHRNQVWELDIYTHPEKLNNFIQHGRQAVIDKYNWSVDGAKLVKLYENLS